MASLPFARRLADAVQPLLRRPGRMQVAALCTRAAEGGGVEVLLVTSRGTGRWILPKGWPMPDRSLAEAAAQEAWEEAGVQGTVDPSPIGRFEAEKVTDSGLPLPCEVRVFRLHVAAQADSFPESSQRTLRWMPPDEAARAVREPGLRALLAAL